MLEYADGKDLLTWFKDIKPPSNAGHLVTFWINFFDLLLGLSAVHNLDPPNDDEEKWYPEG
jgi:hypothetical protein